MKRYHFVYHLIVALLIFLMITPAAADQAVCEVCGQKTSEMKLVAITKDGHSLSCLCGLPFTESHSWGHWESQGDGMHTRTCARGCVETDHCSGGTATCTTPALCIDCGGAYDGTDPDNHNWDSGKVTTASTCKTQGVMTYTCTNNPAHTYTESLPIDPDAHFFRDGVVLQAANCSAEGVISYTCLYSAAHVVQEKLPVNAEAHRWNSGTVIQAADCVNTGEILYTCLDNPAHTRVDFLPIDLTKHQWGTRVVTQEATCTRDGVITLVCALDSNHTGTEYIAALEHKWSVSTVTKEPGCDHTGVMTYTCANDPTHTKNETIPATGHFWGNMEIISEPTCTSEGSKSYICGYDIDHKTVVRIAVDPNAHSYEPTDEIVDVPGICQDGTARVMKCIYCGDTVLEMITEPANHVYAQWSTNADKHHTATCSNCGEASVTLECHEPCPLCRDGKLQLSSVYGLTTEDSIAHREYTVGASAGGSIMQLSLYTETDGSFEHADANGYITVSLNEKQIAAALHPGTTAFTRRALDILQSESSRLMRYQDLVLLGNEDDELLLRLFIHYDGAESEELFCHIDSGVITFRLREKHLRDGLYTVRFVLEEI